MRKTMGVWTSLGLLLGLKAYFDHLDSAGAEATIFLALGLAFGVLGGLIYSALIWQQAKRHPPSVLQAVLTGTGSASAFILLNAAQAVFDPPPAARGGSDLVVCAVLLVVGGVAGAMSSTVAGGRRSADRTTSTWDVERESTRRR